MMAPEIGMDIYHSVLGNSKMGERSVARMAIRPPSYVNIKRNANAQRLRNISSTLPNFFPASRSGSPKKDHPGKGKFNDLVCPSHGRDGDESDKDSRRNKKQ
jgi:hypothetical protein